MNSPVTSGNERPRILIIDDTPANLRLLNSILIEQAYTVHPANSGEHALRFLESTTPDLILLDIRMPGLDGYQVCEQLKNNERTRDIPVIFISAADDVSDKVKAFTAGGVDYIVKPFQVEEVLARVNTHLSLRSLQKHLEKRVQERTAELLGANARLSDEIIERERRVAERTIELQLANGELETFLHSVSHNLCAPLERVCDLAKTLQDNYKNQLDANAQDHLEYIVRSTRNMETLIAALLELSHANRDELRLSAVDLSELVLSVTEDLRSQEPQRRVELRIQPGIIAYADSMLIRIALRNLLNNAWKYSCTQRFAGIEFGVTGDAENRAYFVRDNGIGFDMASAGKLFDAFQRIHTFREFDGAGVGLAAVRRIVERHGGRIWAEAAPNQGATFYFTLGLRPKTIA
ncbi:MAG TPA: response regulator [Burkholderiales bacterium]|nr:response regulator [Burkholderiales bacterium]